MLNFGINIPADLSWRDATIPKKSGGVRHIKIPNPELMEAQKAILQGLYTLYYKGRIEISGCAHGFVPNRNTCTSILRHDIKSPAFLCMDVADFFDNFPVEPVREQLTLSGIGPAEVEMILKLCTCNGHFPQGSPVSPWLTNMGMLETDKKLASYADKNGFVFTRYADDITFSLRPGEKVRPKTHVVNDQVVPYKHPYFDIFCGVDTLLKANLGLRLKRKKNHVIFASSRNKPEILGITIRHDGQGYNADRRLRKETRAGIYNLARKLRKQNGVPLQEDHQKWQELYGAVCYMDYVRVHSPEQSAATADPVIQEDPFNYLLGIFRRKT